MSRSKSSARWLKEHFNDPYVHKAQTEGYRSRAVYKLIEIQQRDRLFKKGMTVIDLGAAPGGWSQVIVEWVGTQGTVIALDVLPIEPMDDIAFIQGDFREDSVLEKLNEVVAEKPVDVVVSDMAPNITGTKTVDQPRAMYLAELAFDFAKAVLKPEGAFLVKIFQGEAFDAYLKMLKASFKQVFVRKPKASRGRSPEVYLVCIGKKPQIYSREV